MRLRQRVERLEKELRVSGGMVVVQELGDGRFSWDEREFEDETALDEALDERFGEDGIQLRVIIRKFC